MPGGSPSRRQHAGDAEPPPSGGGASLFTPAYRTSQPATGSYATGSAGPGRASGPSGPSGPSNPSSPVWPDDDLRSAYSWATDDDSAWPDMGPSGRGTTAPNVFSNAVRGFPPAPGDPPPVYPPGPFAAWNRGQADRQRGRGGQAAGTRGGGRGDTSQLATATITPDEFDTDFSLPAIKDPIPGQADRAAATAGNRILDQRPARQPGGRARHGRPQDDDLQSDQGSAAPGAARPPGKSRPAGRPRKKRQSAWLAIGTAVVIVAAVAAVLVVTLPGSGRPTTAPKPTSTPGPATASRTPPPGPWRYIGSRKTDAVPLTVGELYPSSISAAGTVYTRATQTKSNKCRPALIGAALQAAVRHGNCTQSLRATYLSKSAKVMGTIGVFNLKNYAVANSAASKAGHSDFVAQLAAKAGPAQSIGQGTGIEEAVVKGHYLVLVWAEDTNLSSPSGKAGRARLTAFMNLLINQTVNVSLSHRMAVGKPVKHA
jgi:hypothetical protein